jgi:23S rRNA (guanosine2251-2'-O)-methyltransferase
MSDDRLVIGLHPVREVLRAGRALRHVLVAAGRSDSEVLDEILTLARDARVPVERVDREVLDAQAEGLVHQGVVAMAPAFPYADLAQVLERTDRDGAVPLLVVLDGITDPHNLGSIARSAEAVGAHALLVPSRRAAPVTAVAEKAAAGALAHLPVVRIGNLVRTLKDLADRPLWSLGLDGEGDLPLTDSPLLTEPLALVVGAEGDGMARLTREAVDQRVTLPMRGRVGSLNASVAAAVALYGVLHAREHAVG